MDADPGLLRRVLEELMDNAVKFSDGPVRIRGARDGDRRVRLTVSDRGEGLSEDQLARVGTEFRQVDGTATRRYGGLGLGLALARRITDRFGAELTIDSEPDVGTDVHLLLPVAGGGPR